MGLYMQVREANANKIGDNFNNEIAPNPVKMHQIIERDTQSCKKAPNPVKRHPIL